VFILNRQYAKDGFIAFLQHRREEKQREVAKRLATSPATLGPRGAQVASQHCLILRRNTGFMSDPPQESNKN
jgi:hypothetical protein